MSLLELFLLAVGLSMDAFAVSVCKGLSVRRGSMKQALTVGIWFGGFQALMPMLGWVCVHTVVGYFSAFERFIPWIALVLLCYIGGKMLIEGIRNRAGEDAEEEAAQGLSLGGLLMQGVATSIDALSVGFTIAEYDLSMALVSSLIIAVVTFCICMGGLILGKKAGTRLSGKASILGGVILIAIGLEIFISGLIG